MSRKYLMGFIIILIAVIIGIAYIAINNSNNKNSSDHDTTQPSYSLAQVQLHNNQLDCWMIIEGKVYDVTSFIPQHPGGGYILEGCGKDATSFFRNRPTDGSSHSIVAENLLDNYYIGEVN